MRRVFCDFRLSPCILSGKQELLSSRPILLNDVLFYGTVFAFTSSQVRRFRYRWLPFLWTLIHSITWYELQKFVRLHC